MAYIICFVISIYFMYLAEKSYNKPKLRNIYLFFASLYPILLAGLRDITVGIDVTWYVTPAYFAAENHRDLHSYLKFIAEDDLGFFIYAFFVTKITQSLTILMTLNHVIIIVPIVYSLCQLKKIFGLSIWFGYAIWLLNDYNVSLCIIRQSMSLSIAILAMVMLVKRKWFLMVLFSLLAISFHKTTLIFIALLLLFYYLSQRINKQSTQRILLVCLFSLLLVGKIMIGYILPYMAQKYSDRLESSEAINGGFLTATFLLVASLYPFVISCYKKTVLYTQPFVYMPIIGFVMFFISRDFQYLSRMGYPFNAMLMFSLSLAVKDKTVRILILLALLVAWVVGICIRGDWETYPYLISRDLLL